MRKKDEEKKKPENDKKKIKKLKMCINKKLKNFNCKKKDLCFVNSFQLLLLYLGVRFWTFFREQFYWWVGGKFFFFILANYVNCSKLSLFLNDSMFM